ncbi:hypothetical protein V6N12_043064 [Hibiscus sabdariffa]|uniref:Uncharacterized protein n=1 Tax=Hibiscus sabdariffa TaxID=183260 RepID=A0ABR2DJB0_9ROSI
MAIKNGPQESDINRGNKDGEVTGDGDNEIVVEDINETDLESSEPECDDENHLVYDDEEEEILSIKNTFRASASHFEEGNENALGGLGSGEDTDYLDTSDVGSYETNSDGDFISKNTGKVFFDDSTIVPRFELGMVFKTQQQLKDALYAYAMANRIVPKLNLVEIQKLAKEELKVDLKKKKTCEKARNWAIEHINGRVVHEFNRLFDYVFALRSSDPGGTFGLMVERPTAADIPNFKRLYVCFSALKEGFKKYCRPVISLDVCFLKCPFKGEILSVVGRDSNNAH